MISFLKERTNRVMVDGNSTILGPILFLWNIGCLPDKLSELPEDLKSLEERVVKRRMSFNTSKSYTLRVSRSKSPCWRR